MSQKFLVLGMIVVMVFGAVIVAGVLICGTVIFAILADNCYSACGKLGCFPHGF